MRLEPGPEGASRLRVLLLNGALVGGMVLVWAAARRRRVVIGDLERQPIGPPELESLESPPELD
jgi:hypothetical protein